MYRELLEQRLEALRRQEALALRLLEIGRPIKEDAVKRLAAELPYELPAALLDFYREMDGVKLSWSVNRAEGEIYGGILILSLREGLFGYAKRVERARLDDAFEDVLWNEDSYEESSIRKLRKHRVFESVEGAPAFVTYQPPAVKLFHVYEEELQAIRPAFADYVRLLFQYLGGGRLREHLTERDWKRRIKEDAELQTIAGWS